MALHSLQVEKHALGGLIQNPDAIAEVENFVTEKDFIAEPHNVIYGAIKSAYLQKEKLDKVLLAQKIKNLGIVFKDDINIFDYIDAISFAPITLQATIKACSEVAKLRALRDIDKTCDLMKTHLQKSTNEDFDTIVSDIDSIYGQQIKSFNIKDEPSLLFEDVYEKIEERGNNPIDEVGLATPWPEFNRLYGGLRNKNLYIIASRAKAGKTTWLDETACEMSKMHDIPVLILDTEMSKDEIQLRVATSRSKVGLWYLDTGNWRRNQEHTTKVRTNLKDVKTKYAKVYHLSVGNRSVQHVASICRRWYLKVVGRGNKCLFIYDYLKIVDPSGNNRQEYQLMGDKVDFMKKLAEELDVPFLTACQNNREGVVGARDPSEIIDDERSIGLSDRITQFASAVWILRRRTPEEMTLDTPESGTHKLIEVVVRWQGRDAGGHMDFIRRRFPDGKTKYVKNFVNFEIRDFSVEERGSLRDTIERQNAAFLVQDGENPAVEEETL